MGLGPHFLGGRPKVWGSRPKIWRLGVHLGGWGQIIIIREIVDLQIKCEERILNLCQILKKVLSLNLRCEYEMIFATPHLV